VPREHVRLNVSGESIFPATQELPEEEPLDDLVVSVAARCFLQVEVAGDAPDDVVVELLDERGGALPISEFGSTSSVVRKPLARGSSVVLLTSEDARTLRARAGWSPLAREYASIPVLLSADELTEIRLEDF